jgi:CheY-like chemotaxis protein
MSEFCKPKVIVVDDEHLIADTLTTILSRAGYDVRAVYSGDEAVEMALNFQPVLMLSDVRKSWPNELDCIEITLAVLSVESGMSHWKIS